MNNKLSLSLESYFNEPIKKHRSVGGGCIANAQIVEFNSGLRVFVKSGFSNGMFQNEANGLREIEKAEAIKVPKVLATFDDALVLEAISPGNRSSFFFSILGTQFAKMHKYTANAFGFYEDNFIGATPQKNKPNDEEAQSWTTFFWNKRLLYQFNLAHENGYVDPDLRKSFEALEDKIDEVLKGSEEPPALLHGDLWSGNYMINDEGMPVLIDPAVYYGHREADLAMTALFGGFPSEFYSAYQNEYPLKKGWEHRQNLYKLYHILNHLNLFGSGYYHQAKSLITYYL